MKQETKNYFGRGQMGLLPKPITIMIDKLIRWALVALIALVFGWLVSDPETVLGWLVKIPLLAILWGCFKVLDDFLPESLKKEKE